MKYRKMRIWISAVCGILCLLVIALWVRSYYAPVQLHLLIINLPPYVAGFGIELWQGVATLLYAQPRLAVKIHCLLLVLLFGTLAGLPWIQWSQRFSLRTFLVVTAFVAVVLWLVMAMR